MARPFWQPLKANVADENESADLRNKTGRIFHALLIVDKCRFQGYKTTMDKNRVGNSLGKNGPGNPARKGFDATSKVHSPKESEAMNDNQDISDDDAPIEVFVAAIPDKSQPMNRADWMSDEDAKELDDLLDVLLEGGEDR